MKFPSFRTRFAPASFDVWICVCLIPSAKSVKSAHKREQHEQTLWFTERVTCICFGKKLWFFPGSFRVVSRPRFKFLPENIEKMLSINYRYWSTVYRYHRVIIARLVTRGTLLPAKWIFTIVGTQNTWQKCVRLAWSFVMYAKWVRSSASWQAQWMLRISCSQIGSCRTSEWR